MCWPDLGGIVAAVAGPAAATTTLVALAVMEHNKAKPDDKKKIDRLIGKLADAADKASKTEPHERGQVIRAAEAALSKYLPKMDITHYQLARDAFEVGGFPVAATARILKALAKIEEDEKVAETDRLFGALHGRPDAIKLAEDVFNATFEQALTNEDYFKSLEPQLIVGIAEGIGDLKRGQDGLVDGQADLLAEMKAMRSDMASKSGLSIPQVEAILISFGHEEIPQERWESTLLESAAKLKELETQLAQLSNDEPEIAALLDLARAAIERAEFDKAEDYLAEAEQRDIDAGEIRIRRAASSREKRAELAAARGRHIEAADHYAEAARQVRGFDAMNWARLKYNEGRSAYERGQYHPEPDIMRRAIKAYGAALEERTQDRVPLDWARTQNNLGTALLALGKRGDDEALQDAITAFGAALEEETQDRVPLDWAGTQNNLGNALSTLGQRGDEAALQDAITAYRAALEEWAQDRVPLDWAMTQNNLGKAYETWGDQSGERAHSKQAVEYYQAALSEFKGRAPAYEKIAARNLERVRGKLAE